MENYNGNILDGTWIQSDSGEGVNGPFAGPGGYSVLGSKDDKNVVWNTDIDTIHPDAGILWWLEFVRTTWGKDVIQHWG